MRNIHICLIVYILSILLSQNFVEIPGGDIQYSTLSSTSCNWIDFDNDGLLDLFVGNWDGQDVFYKNTGGDNFTEMFNQVTSDGPSTSSSTCGDFDSDGFTDIFISTLNSNNRLYRNIGDFQFELITDMPDILEGNLSRGCAWVDINNDGNLDLYVANSDMNNFLYISDASGILSKITDNIIVNEGGWSVCPNFSDYDNDGDLDLFVANFYNQINFLYRNNEENRFVRVTTGSFNTDYSSSFGASWGDIDNDLDVDLFVANRFGENNIIYRNDGNSNFTKLVNSVVSTSGGNSDGSTFADLDNDGDLDLLVCNWGNQRDLLFINDGYGNFIIDTVNTICGIPSTSRGVASGDYDNDGDIDVFVSKNGHNKLFKNLGNNNKWLEVICNSFFSNKSSLGTRIEIKSIINDVPTWQIREISSQSGYYSQNSNIVHFGVENADVVDTLKIYWPSGLLNIFIGIATNQIFIASEAEGYIMGDVNFDGEVNIFDVMVLIDYVLEINIPDLPLSLFDLNSDNNVNIMDMILVLNIIFSE